MNLETKDEGVKETAADIEKEIKSTGEILKDLSLNTVSDSKSESVTATMSHMVVAMASTLGKFCLESFLIFFILQVSCLVKFQITLVTQVTYCN